VEPELLQIISPRGRAASHGSPSSAKRKVEHTA
jgi:hypothetical protein